MAVPAAAVKLLTSVERGRGEVGKQSSALLSLYGAARDAWSESIEGKSR